MTVLLDDSRKLKKYKQTRLGSLRNVNLFVKKYRCSFVSSSEISTKTIKILVFNFYRQSIEIASSYYNGLLDARW